MKIFIAVKEKVLSLICYTLLSKTDIIF